MEFMVNRTTLVAMRACEQLRERFLQRYPDGHRLTLALVREYDHAESSGWMVDKLSGKFKGHDATHIFAHDLAEAVLRLLPTERFPRNTRAYVEDGLALERGAEERRQPVDISPGMPDMCQRTSWRWARDAPQPEFSVGDFFYAATLPVYAGLQTTELNTLVIEAIWDWLELPRE